MTINEHIAPTRLTRLKVLSNGERMKVLRYAPVLIRFERRVKPVSSFILRKIVEVKRRRQEMIVFVSLVLYLQPYGTNALFAELYAENLAGLLVLEDDGRHLYAALARDLSPLQVRVVPFRVGRKCDAAG